jgi:GTP cyclohydrolase III
MRQIGYVTVEECTGDNDFYGIPHLVINEFSNIEASIVEQNEMYFVIKYICEDFEEVQELVATISHILTGENIIKFSITINNEEL